MPESLGGRLGLDFIALSKADIFPLCFRTDKRDPAFDDGILSWAERKYGISPLFVTELIDLIDEEWM
jgi:hypothetical protein